VYADCRGVNHPHAGNADALTQSMLHDAGVVLVPGLDFGPHTAQHYIRLSYATAMDHLEEAVSRLGRLFSQ
jgi:aspartate/methionine/tyrosine aminotransferase